jgi:hypothetical protein
MRTKDIENYSRGKQFGDSLGIRPLVCPRTVVQLFSGGCQGLQWNANQCAVGVKLSWTIRLVMDRAGG